MIRTARLAGRLPPPTIECARVGSMLRSALLFVCVAANTGLVAAAAVPVGTSVTVDIGRLRGAALGEIVSFKGIPFAQPPVGEKPGGPLANYAIMDQIAALKWVRRNIAAFGGDAGNVTICGESAGGMSVHILMTSPAAAGLFQKAIVQSGGGRASLLRGRLLAGDANSAEAIGLAFARQAGVVGTSARALQKLRALPAEALLNGLNMATMGAAAATYVGGPVLDGQIMAAEPARLYAEGKAAHVPLMVGANSLDIGPMQGKSVDELLAQFGSDADRARTVYEVKSDDDVKKVAFRMGGDQMMGEPARYVARTLTVHGPAWPAYDARSDLILDFTDRGPVVGADPWQARLDLAEAFNLAHESGAPGVGGR